MKKKIKQTVAINFLNRVTIILLVLAALAIVANSVFYFLVVQAEDAQYNLTHYANGFMDASAYLTDEVRAYAATGDKQHYDNYWEEVNELKNRENCKQHLEEGGITDEELDMIERMAAISDELVPHEKEAMDYAAAGNTAAALEIVYGTYYKDKVAEITALRNSFLSHLNERTTRNIKTLGLVHELLNGVVWALTGAVILLQLFQKRALHKIAYVDGLTGGHNYNAFRERMRGCIEVSGSGFVVSADLRDFGTINNTCGVSTGDLVIREMDRIINGCLKKGELCAHVVGDRFAIFMHGENEDEIIGRLEELKDALGEIVKLLDVPHVVPKFGVRSVVSTVYPELAYGDANFAKQQLKGRADRFYTFFDEGIQKGRIADQKLEDGFAAALQEGRFEMWYQPQYAVDGEKFIAAEALVRWRNADGSITPPKVFIPLFERNGMIAQLDENNFRSVCASVRKWLDEGLEVVPISVNVSRSSMYYGDIVERYMAIVNLYSVPTQLIKLEVTESAIVGSDAINEAINRFREYGFKILVDDFGSGYSSLYLLTKDCFDNIKIDKSIVDCIGTASGESLLAAIIKFAHQFNMSVTAEGVEVKEQADFLAGQGCDIIQGYYYSKPLIAAEFEKMLHKN